MACTAQSHLDLNLSLSSGFLSRMGCSSYYSAAAGFQSLPEDVLRSLAAFFRPKDLLALAATCKSAERWFPPNGTVWWDFVNSLLSPPTFYKPSEIIHPKLLPSGRDTLAALWKATQAPFLDRDSLHSNSRRSSQSQSHSQNRDQTSKCLPSPVQRTQMPSRFSETRYLDVMLRDSLPKKVLGFLYVSKERPMITVFQCKSVHKYFIRNAAPGFWLVVQEDGPESTSKQCSGANSRTQKHVVRLHDRFTLRHHSLLSGHPGRSTPLVNYRYTPNDQVGFAVDSSDPRFVGCVPERRHPDRRMEDILAIVSSGATWVEIPWLDLPNSSGCDAGNSSLSGSVSGRKRRGRLFDNQQQEQEPNHSGFVGGYSSSSSREQEQAGECEDESSSSGSTSCEEYDYNSHGRNKNNDLNEMRSGQHRNRNRNRNRMQKPGLSVSGSGSVRSNRNRNRRQPNLHLRVVCEANANSAGSGNGYGYGSGSGEDCECRERRSGSQNKSTTSREGCGCAYGDNNTSSVCRLNKRKRVSPTSERENGSGEKREIQQEKDTHNSSRKRSRTCSSTKSTKAETGSSTETNISSRRTQCLGGCLTFEYVEYVDRGNALSNRLNTHIDMPNDAHDPSARQQAHAVAPQPQPQSQSGRIKMDFEEVNVTQINDNLGQGCS
eukprot:CAMPEP_0197521958 /NCGR_PEP_ID=MMETSP1318-20131121/7159_1 /TAXON_ID=552666 /ORGANISM="Partenskyella glossopodia, Strain RCC365" /LENGTH=660 /DNA_ID=CAMNT_0043074145 /DNA_START=250 /DNA_END=2232 /DNA_ORIENTATION=+